MGLVRLALLFAVVGNPWPIGAAQEKSRPAAGVRLDTNILVCRSFADFGFSVSFARDTYTGEKIHSAEYELRRVGDDTGVIRWAYLHEIDVTFDDARPVRRDANWGGFYERILRRLGEAAPGEYRLAFLINGERCSRVVSFTIDPNFDIRKAPTFQFSALEPNPFEKLSIPVLHIIGPTPAGDKITNLTAFAAPLIVDGNPHEVLGYTITGAVGPIQSGHRHTQTIHLQGYRPKVDPAANHVLFFRFEGYESKSFTFDPWGQPLNREWDARTPQMRDSPPQKPILQGTITDAKGEPAVGYEVFLKVMGQPATTDVTNEGGEYAFYNFPPGVYRVGATPPPPAASPVVFKEKIELKADQPTVCDLDFRKLYQFSGRVIDQAGKPVADIPINATWIDSKANAEFLSTTRSDKDGSFSMGGPFKTITYVGVANGKSRPRPRHDVKPGDDNITFVLPLPSTK